MARLYSPNVRRSALRSRAILGPRVRKTYGELGMKCCQKGTWSPSYKQACWMAFWSSKINSVRRCRHECSCG